MSMHFSEYLTKDKIMSASSHFGFTDPTYLEKFIMDFEMYYHVSEKIDCITRGGMCMPFHTREDLQRLSIDIDIITSKSVKETSEIMDDLDGLLGMSIKKKIPKQAYPIKNLLSYDVKYRSCLGVDDKIKVDFLCDTNIDLPQTRSSPGVKMFGCELDFPVKILKHGALIGDKLSTLSITTIGLPRRRYDDIPKQIYDISTLLKLTDIGKIKESFEVFNKFTTYKVKIYEKNPPYTVSEIIDDINNSLQSFLHFDLAFSITPEHDGRYGQFKGRYLGNSKQQYKKTEHISDILLVQLFSKNLANYLNKSISMNDACDSIHNSIDVLREMKTQDADTRSSERKKIIASMPKMNFNKNILKGSSLEHVYLIKEIFS